MDPHDVMYKCEKCVMYCSWLHSCDYVLIVGKRRPVPVVECKPYKDKPKALRSAWQIALPGSTPRKKPKAKPPAEIPVPGGVVRTKRQRASK